MSDPSGTLGQESAALLPELPCRHQLRSVETTTLNSQLPSNTTPANTTQNPNIAKTETCRIHTSKLTSRNPTRMHSCMALCSSRYQLVPTCVNCNTNVALTNTQAAGNCGSCCGCCYNLRVTTTALLHKSHKPQLYCCISHNCTAASLCLQLRQVFIVAVLCSCCITWTWSITKVLKVHPTSATHAAHTATHTTHHTG